MSRTTSEQVIATRHRRWPRVNHQCARDVASAYVGASSRDDALTVTAFALLVVETDRLFARITRPAHPRAIRVIFTTCESPYRDADELIASVRNLRLLEVATVAGNADRRHPLMGSERGGPYDRFRAVHDVVGHAHLGLGFDRDGEFSVWLAQARLHSPLARWALATELHGQHSVRWTTGDVAEPKAVLLEPRLLRRSYSSPGSALNTSSSALSASSRVGKTAIGTSPP